MFAKPAVTTLFSSKYEASVWPFRIYLLFLPLRITVFGQVLVSLGETRLQLEIAKAWNKAAFNVTVSRLSGQNKGKATLAYQGFMNIWSENYHLNPM